MIDQNTSSQSNRNQTNTKEFEIVPSSASVLDRYDGFLIDQWGVLHNGIEALEHTTETIRQLKQANKKLVIVSNSPALESDTLKVLGELGFDKEAFVMGGGAVTSGSLAVDYIRRTYDKKPTRALVFGWQHSAAPCPREFLTHCGDNLEIVDWHQIQDNINSNEERDNDELPVDVIIVQGNEVLLSPNKSRTVVDGKEKVATDIPLGDFVTSGDTSQVIDPLLELCASFHIPLLCIDPDFITVEPDGTQLYMPGTVARRYEELGGSCRYFGKPHPEIFQRALDRLNVPDRTRVAMIGDSLHHDIKGASSVVMVDEEQRPLDSILVLGGVHRKELGHAYGDLVPHDKLHRLFDEVGHTPTIVAPIFKM